MTLKVFNGINSTFLFYGANKFIFFFNSNLLIFFFFFCNSVLENHMLYVAKIIRKMDY